MVYIGGPEKQKKKKYSKDARLSICMLSFSERF